MIYVDNAFIKFGSMTMCHMFGDTIEELHAFAEKLGIKRIWFQPKSWPHYDVSLSKRAMAITLGAKKVDELEHARMRLWMKKERM